MASAGEGFGIDRCALIYSCMALTKKGEIAALTGLRGLAAILVVAVHYWPWTRVTQPEQSAARDGFLDVVRPKALGLMRCISDWTLRLLQSAAGPFKFLWMMH
jgi:peptidoglycan/LPS O-acetylase OafA/YrhL